MDIEHDLLTFTAVDKTGRVRPNAQAAVLSGVCARGLVGAHRPTAGALLEPEEVLTALEGFTPGTREARTEYSAILRLALVADAYGLVLRCGSSNATAWTPADEPAYWDDEVQTALSLVAGQLDCTVEQAAHRLFALDSSTGTPLLETSRDIIAGRLIFVGTHDASTTEVGAAREH